MTNKFAGMLGLCAKAGKVSTGEFSSEKSIKSGKAKLCILAADASENTKKHFRDMCSYRQLPCVTVDAGKTELGHMVGRRDRTSLTVDDTGFAESLGKIIGGGTAHE